MAAKKTTRKPTRKTGARPKKSRASGPRLYRALSPVDLPRRGRLYEMVDVHWFRVGRSDPPAPLESIIDGYDGLDDRLKRVARAAACELLTAEEVEALETYLAGSHGAELKREEVRLPLDPGEVRPYSLTRVDGPAGVVRLAEMRGWPLPFEVAGYYTVEGAPARPLANEADWPTFRGTAWGAAP